MKLFLLNEENLKFKRKALPSAARNVFNITGRIIRRLSDDPDWGLIQKKKPCHPPIIGLS
jgi:hypothetical protein